MRTADDDFARMLAGYSLTTAEIIYRLPDHQRLLQSYIWQDYDLAPRFPKLIEFLDFWAAKALLDWQVEMGADEAVGDLPVNRYDLPAEAPKPRAAAAQRKSW